MTGDTSFTNWRDHPQDYIVAQDEPVPGQPVFHIFDVTHSLSIIIEEQSVVRPIVQEMVALGVRVVSIDEAIQILHPNRTFMYQESPKHIRVIGERPRINGEDILW